MIVGAVASYYWLIVPLQEKIDQMPPGPERAAASGGMMGGLFGSCFGLIYPVILLIFMFRPQIAAALRGQQTEPAYGPPQPPFGPPQPPYVPPESPYTSPPPTDEPQ